MLPFFTLLVQGHLPYTSTRAELRHEIPRLLILYAPQGLRRKKKKKDAKVEMMFILGSLH